jgi:hypothetical protein
VSLSLLDETKNEVTVVGISLHYSQNVKAEEFFRKSEIQVAGGQDLVRPRD